MSEKLLYHKNWFWYSHLPYSQCLPFKFHYLLFQIAFSFVSRIVVWGISLSCCFVVIACTEIASRSPSRLWVTVSFSSPPPPLPSPSLQMLFLFQNLQFCCICSLLFEHFSEILKYSIWLTMQGEYCHELEWECSGLKLCPWLPCLPDLGPLSIKMIGLKMLYNIMCCFSSWFLSFISILAFLFPSILLCFCIFNHLCQIFFFN